MRGITVDVMEDRFCDLLNEENFYFLRRKRSASIATLVGDVRPFIFRL